MSQSDVNANKRVKSYSNNDELPDCTFVIDGQEVQANKLKLTYSSPVFEKMFFGEMASDRITITDIRPEHFCQMLEFIYTRDVKFESVLHAWSLFYIAHKYLLSDFAKACVSYIQGNLTVSTLTLSYEYAEVYEIKDLQITCLRVIEDYIRGIFHDECSYHMKPSTVVAVLNLPVLNISNEDLVKGVIHWAIAESKMEDVTLSAQNIIFLLRSLNILQYLTNLKFEINDNPNKLVLECCKLIKNMSDPKAPIKIYRKKHWCLFCPCRITYKIAARMTLRERDALISHISVNQDSFLFGLIILTEDKVSGVANCEYNGSIKIQISQIDNPDVIVITTVSRSLPYETLIYVPLSKIFVLECDKKYAVKIGYSNFDKKVKHSSVLCNYMSSKLCHQKRNTVFSFEEMDGSVIRGVCFYPI